VGRGGGVKVFWARIVHGSTAAREAGEHRWTVGRGGDGKVLLHSSTAAMLDERMDLGGGQRRQ
jgi:hypothetical protein